MRVSTVVQAAAWTPPSSSSSHHQHFHHSSRLYLKEQQKSSPYYGEYRPQAEMWPVTTHPDSFLHRNVMDCFPRDLRAALLLVPPPKSSTSSRRIIRRTTLGLWVVAFVTVLQQLGIRIATTHRFWAWTSLALTNARHHGRNLLGQMWYTKGHPHPPTTTSTTYRWKENDQRNASI